MRYFILFYRQSMDIHGYLDRRDFYCFYRSIEDVFNPSGGIG
jgi:hypothetical protein